jgi:hypothetical protein
MSIADLEVVELCLECLDHAVSQIEVLAKAIALLQVNFPLRSGQNCLSTSIKGPLGTRCPSQWSIGATHVQVADNDHLLPSCNQPPQALPQHQMIVHLVLKLRIGSFIRTVQVDEHKQAKVEHERASFEVQSEKVIWGLFVGIGYEVEFVRKGV